MENNHSDERLSILKFLLKKTLINSPQWKDDSICDEYRYKSNKDISDQFDKLISNVDRNFDSHQIETDEIDRDVSFPFDIVTNDTLGRHLVSTRDIKVGEVLLVEKFIVSGPVAHVPYGNHIPVCVQCFTEVRNYLCPQCGFFLCQEGTCEKLHKSQPECQLLSKLKLINDQKQIHNFEEKNDKSISQRNECKDKLKTTSEAYLKFIDEQKLKILKFYPALPTLKTLCLVEKSKMAESIIFSLQGDVQRGSRRHKVNQLHIVDIVKLMTTSSDEETLHKLAAIWDTNAFQSVERDRKIQVLFALSSFFTHSCKPNCENFLGKGSDIMIVRAVEAIPKNSVLTINYADPLWPTYIRRDHLQISKKFWCNCERCEDSTEFGTYMGHIRCDSCSHLTLSTNNCNNYNTVTCSNCRTEMKYSKVLAEEASICNLLSNIQIVDYETYEKISSKISSLFGKKFHEGHHILWKIRYSLIVDHPKKDITDIEDEKLLKIARLVFDLYKFCSSVLPTSSKKKAYVTKELLRYSKEAFKRSGITFLDEKEIKIIEEESMMPLNW